MSATPLRRWFSIALFLGLILGMVGLASPASAGTSRTVSVSAKPTAVVAGGKVTFSGVLVSTPRSPQGSPVQVQRKSGTRWVTVRNGVTKDAVGRYTAVAPVPKASGVHLYRVYAPSKGMFRSAASKTVRITALRPVRAIIRKSASSVLAGQKLTFRGTVSPFVRGTGVIVQWRVGTGRWSKYTTAVLNSRGSWTKTVKAKRTARYRVYVPRRGGNAPAYSGATLVTVVPPPRITTTSLPAAAQAYPYSIELGKTGGNGTWSLVKGFLPFGMTLSPSTGVISGTPTAIETASFTVRFAETSTRLSDTQALSIRVVASVPPRITTTALPGATKGTGYGAQLNKTGNAGTWSLASGSLPNGIGLNGSTGELSGTPTRGGTANFVVRFTETASGLTDTQALSIAVTANPPVITTTTLADAKKGAAYSATLAKTGNAGTWTLAAGTLPTGITLSSGGVLSGTPANSVTPGNFAFTVRFTESDADGLSDTQALVLTVNQADAPVIATNTLPDGKVGDAYVADLEATPNVGTWAVTAGTLPNGLVLNATTGGISGTPTVAGTFNLTIRFTAQAGGASASKPFSITIEPEAPVGPTITTTTIPDADQGIGYTTQLAKTGLAGTWSKTAGDFPAGVSLNVNSGVISGTPTEAGDFAFTVRFTETAGGLFDEQELTLHVDAAAPPEITTTTVPNAQQYAAYSTTLTKTPGIPGATGTWTVSSGTLPAGLTLNAGTGVLSGTPTASGEFGFTVTYTETASTLSDSQALTLTVNPATPPAVTTNTLPVGLVNTSYTTTLSKTAGVPGGPGTWSISAGSLSGSGLTLNSTTGAITGTPTVRGDWFFTARYTETASGLFGQKALTVHVANDNKAIITTPALANGTVGTPYSQDINGTGQSGTGEGWEIVSGSLPNGLSINVLNGVVSGTPTQAGSFTFKVRMTRYVLIVPQTDDERTYTIVITAP